VNEEPAAFFAEFSTSIRNGDTAFLTARLLGRSFETFACSRTDVRID